MKWGPRMQHLVKRGGFWYYRCRYPWDLRERLQQEEVRVSLRVRRHSTAKRLVKLLDHRAEEFFTLLRGRNGSMLTGNQLQRIVTEHFRKALEGAEGARAHGEHLPPDHG